MGGISERDHEKSTPESLGVASVVLQKCLPSSASIIACVRGKKTEVILLARIQGVGSARSFAIHFCCHFFDVIVTSSTVKNKFLSQRFKPRNYAKNIISHLILLKYITEIAINNPPVWTGWKKQKWKKV